jgi:hypothetical protein
MRSATLYKGNEWATVTLDGLQVFVDWSDSGKSPIRTTCPNETDALADFDAVILGLRQRGFQPAAVNPDTARAGQAVDLSDRHLTDRSGRVWTVHPVIAVFGDIFEVDHNEPISKQLTWGGGNGAFGWIAVIKSGNGLVDAMWDTTGRRVARGFELYASAQEALTAIVEAHGLTNRGGGR